jgi:hypothetical protein
VCTYLTCVSYSSLNLSRKKKSRRNRKKKRGKSFPAQLPLQPAHLAAPRLGGPTRPHGLAACVLPSPARGPGSRQSRAAHQRAFPTPPPPARLRGPRCTHPASNASLGPSRPPGAAHSLGPARPFPQPTPRVPAQPQPARSM